MLSSHIAYSPAKFNRVTRSTKRKSNINNTMPLVQNSTQTKQISIIGLHDSHSQFLPLLLCKRLTLAVLSQYSTTLAYCDQNKLQHKQNTWSINTSTYLTFLHPPFTVYKTSPITNYHISPTILFFLAIKCMLSKST